MKCSLNILTMSSYIYIISNGEAFKVGLSKDPKRRVRQLQTGNPKKLSLEYCVEIEEAPVKILESIMHRYLKLNHLSGEWFSADFIVIKNLLDFVKIRYDNSDTEREFKLGILDYEA